MADGHAKVSSIDIPNTKFNVGNVNLDDIRMYRNNNTLVYDGKRLKWNGKYAELETFIRNSVGLSGNWISPGGNSKKFISNSDLTITWYRGKQRTLVIQGSEGESLKELLVSLNSELMLPHQSDTGVQSAEFSVTTTCTGDRSEVSNLITENNDYGTEIAAAKIDIISPIDNSSLAELENFIDDSFCNIMNSRHSEVTKGTVEQVFVNSTPFKQREDDNITTIKVLFDNFKEKVEYEISNLLGKLTKQDETINTNKQDICKLREENLHLKSRISELEGKMASASIEKSPGAIETSSATPTSQCVLISTKEKANEDQLPESNVSNMQSNSEVSVPTYGNSTLQPRTQQSNKNRHDCPPKNSIPCPFLLRRGWCRKGDRCDFQHPKPSRDIHKHNVPCPFLQNRGFCLKDDRCDFSHAWVPTKRSVLRTTTSSHLPPAPFLYDRAQVPLPPNVHTAHPPQLQTYSLHPWRPLSYPRPLMEIPLPSSSFPRVSPQIHQNRFY